MSEIDVTRIEEALTAQWGERCGEIDEDCPVCQVWSEFDSLLAERDALQAKVKDLDARQYSLAYAIAGGEDAPGLLDSVSTDKISEMIRTERARKNDEFNSGYAAGHAAGFEAAREAAADVLTQKAQRSFTYGDGMFGAKVASAAKAIRALQPQQKEEQSDE